MYSNVSCTLPTMTGAHLNKQYHVHSSECSSYCQSTQKSKRQKFTSFISNAPGSKYDNLLCHECNAIPSSDTTMNKGDQIMSQTSLAPAIITQEEIDDEYENDDDYSSIICNKMPSQTQVDEVIFKEDQTMANPPAIPINFDKESTPSTHIPPIQPRVSYQKFQADEDRDEWLKHLSAHVESSLSPESESMPMNHSDCESEYHSESDSDCDLDELNELKDQDYTKIYDGPMSGSPVSNSDVKVNFKKWKPSTEASSQVCF